MEYVALIILLALVQYTWFSVRVGIARGKYGVKAPKTTGDEAWECLYRVQENTLEQLIIFIPGMVAFALYVRPTWVLVPGLLFLVGRQLYSYEYINKPESRTPGMALTLLANAALLAGGLTGVILKLF